MTAQPQSPATTSDSMIDAPVIPAVPRPLTLRARRRSWAELPVRPWIVLTVASSLVVIFFLVTRIQEAMNDRRLINNGVNVTAKFVHVDNDFIKKRRPRNEAMSARVTFPWHGKPFQLDIARLEAKPGAYAVVGEDLAIRVDPNDPNRWTEENVPKPWAAELTAVGLLLPLAGAVFAVMLLQRRAVLKTWINEPLQPATVIETRQNAAAPRSRVLRFTLNNEPDQRIWTALMPVSAGIPSPGESIWMICSPKNPSRAVVAKLYEEG